MASMNGVSSTDPVAADRLEPPTARRTFATVDLGAIRRNVNAMRGELSPGTGLAAIVKADAYGHGAVQTAQAAVEAGASMLGVAMAEEAVPLRQAGLDVPILVIGPSNSRQLALGAELDLDMTVFTPSHLLDLERAAEKSGRKARIHLKVDTGMGRIGLRSGDELMEVLDVLSDCPHLTLAGMFTHFATADNYEDEGGAEEQHARFGKMAAIAASCGHHPQLHVSNSAAAQNIPSFDHDMVRYGISLYGYAPAPDRAVRQIGLEPAMQVWAEVSHVKELQAGDTVGYGATFRADRPTRVATVQIGYGDGYNRLLSGRGRMIVPAAGGARYAPVLGRVCMDMTMIDVTGIPDLRPGSLVLAMGRLDGLHFDADDIAGLCGTISYEVLLDYTARLPRLYIDSSK